MALQVVWRLNVRIRTHEAANQRVVDAAIHVDDAHLVQMLVHGKATIGVFTGDGV